MRTRTPCGFTRLRRLAVGKRVNRGLIQGRRRGPGEQCDAAQRNPLDQPQHARSVTPFALSARLLRLHQLPPPFLVPGGERTCAVA